MATRPIESGRIRVGIGGWSFDPWRTTFYPADVPKKRELPYAATQVTAIEINATYYRTQTATSFARWRDETPDDFVFTVKASRYATNRRVLAEAADAIAHFVDSGMAELGPKLGPLLWQFMPTKRFDEADFAAFLALLPEKLGSLRLRHAIEVRHESFACEAFVALARKHGVAIVCGESDDYPMIDEVTADFTYARLMRARADLEQGYPDPEIDAWTARARAWSRSDTADAAMPVSKPAAEASTNATTKASTNATTNARRDVFVFFINGAKERAPAAAKAMLAGLAAA